MENSTNESTRHDVQKSPRYVERHDSANVAQDAIIELDPKALAASATAAMATSDQSDMPESSFGASETTGHDYERTTPLQSATEMQSSSLSVRSSLTPQTIPKSEMRPPPLVIDTITSSPTLSKHAIPVAQGTANTLPVVQPASPMYETESGSPQKERLPSFRQLTGQLSELAEAAATHEPQMYSHHHSHSFGSTTSQSPRLPYHPTTFSTSTQTSPVTHFAYAMSPTSAISEIPHQTYGSPQQYAASGAYFTDRRTSTAAESAPPFPPSLPSASMSMGDSYGQTGSGAELYSTSHTTTIDHLTSGDGAPRPVLPPPPGMPPSMVLMTAYSCDQPGCTAAPFQTQYLLSSHRNVHSASRPHFCPVERCPRSEGGKGFKRKNEMIRHGLVHNSPGYVCPFCPDKEHRYPRPDNLQRHVRVHHVDKDRDDAALREVLAQRIEGIGKQRRRRTNANGTVVT